MTRDHVSYAAAGLVVGDGGRASVYTGGQDIRLAWRLERPYGGGYGDAPYGVAPYGGVEDGVLRGSLVQVWFGRTGAGAAPYVLAREARIMDYRYVYREADNRADAARYGLPFQAQVRFVVRPLTTRGAGVSAEIVTTSAASPDPWRIPSPALDDLSDVNAAAPADGDALVWDAATSRWIAAAVSGGPGGPTALDDLTDVTITTPATGAVLVYNGSVWVDGQVDLADADAVTGLLPQANVANLTTDLAAKQPLDDELSALAALISASDKLPYFTGVGVAALADFTAAGRSMVAAANAAAQTALLSAMVGDSGSGGTKGLVPAPVAGDASKFLRGDGTFATPTASIADGDKGDIVVSGSGAVWSLDAAITARIDSLYWLASR